MYVIGGIVDRSVKKALTFNTAKELGITCQRLPIQEYIPNRAGSHVLNIDYVLDIIHKQIELKDWVASLTAVIPLRKQVGKSNAHQSSSSSQQQEESQTVPIEEDNES